MNAPQPDAALRALEERYTFLERDVEALSRVVAEQALLLERLTDEVRELRHSKALGTPEAEAPRTLEDDRPPHY